MIITGYEKPIDQFSKNELIEIAKKYLVYYQTASGIGKMSGYSKLTKEQLINIIKNDEGYKKANPRNAKEPNRRNQQLNRFKNFKESLLGTESPDELMNEILRLSENTERPYIESGKYYTFIYYAKTPRILYDRYPLIRGGVLLPKGFNGINFHWFNQIRQYNTEDGDRLLSGIYEINGSEFATLRSIPYRKIIQN